ncbi:MAG: hypothetical protein EAZ89_21470, partial [Bacteroidetes bacterium]
MTAKRVPGADWVYMVYDKLDRVVATQDGAQRPAAAPANWSWTFVKYDQLSRPIVTGKVVLGNGWTQASLQNHINTTYPSNSESAAGTVLVDGYTNTAWPDVSQGIVTVYSTTYYDTYDFDRNGSPDKSYQADAANFAENQAFARTRNKVTGVKVRVLESSTYSLPTWLWTVTFYDSRGREIQTIADNHLGGQEKVNKAYNFAGELLRTRHEHTGVPVEVPPVPAYSRGLTTWEKYTYDAKGRLRQTETRTEDPLTPSAATDWVVSERSSYNIIGQRTVQQLHSGNGASFWQSVDYRFTILGWLQRINDPYSLNGDLYAQQNYYETGASGIKSGASDQFNGNIAAIEWRSAGYTHRRAYTY